MSEKNLSRRSFLKALSAFGAAAATTAVGIPALAEESVAVFVGDDLHNEWGRARIVVGFIVGNAHNGYRIVSLSLCLSFG